MQLILLSGGSGKRLWPLSNDSYSKQFLRLLPTPNGNRESMVQRVVRQIQESQLNAEITIATGEGQRDAISCQLGSTVDVVTEPERRDTFPAIALACMYLEKEKGCALRKKHQSKVDRNKENQTQPVVNKRFCSCLLLQPNSRERQDNARFPLPSHYLFRYLPEA